MVYRYRKRSHSRNAGDPCKKASKAAQRQKTHGSGVGEQDLFGSVSDLTEEQDDTMEPTDQAEQEAPAAQQPSPVETTVVD